MSHGADSDDGWGEEEEVLKENIPSKPASPQKPVSFPREEVVDSGNTSNSRTFGSTSGKNKIDKLNDSTFDLDTMKGRNNAKIPEIHHEIITESEPESEREAPFSPDIEPKPKGFGGESAKACSTFASTFGRKQSFDYQDNSKNNDLKPTGFGRPSAVVQEEDKPSASNRFANVDGKSGGSFGARRTEGGSFGGRKVEGGSSFGKKTSDPADSGPRWTEEEEKPVERTTCGGGFGQKKSGGSFGAAKDVGQEPENKTTCGGGFGQKGTQSAGFGQPKVENQEENKKTTTGGGFGQKSAQSAGFGQSTVGSQDQEKKTTGGGFGKKEPQSNGFGQSTGGGFGQKTPQSSGFGNSKVANQEQENKTTTGGGFGRKEAQSNGFGQSKTFGQEPEKKTVGSSFGKSGGGFGQSQTQPEVERSRSFGRPSAESADRPRGFGTPQSTSSFGSAGPQSSSFGRSKPVDDEQQAPKTGSFGGSKPFGQSNGFGFGKSSHEAESTGFGSSNNEGFGESRRTGGFGFGSDGQMDRGFGGENRERRDDRSNKCFNCHQEGHISNDCPEPKKERGPLICFNCDEEGHHSKDCEKPRREPKPIKCYNCEEEGHGSKDCPHEKRQRCQNCREEGHELKDCPKEIVPATQVCPRCNEGIHWSRDCPTRPRDAEGNVIFPYVPKFKKGDDLYKNCKPNKHIDFEEKIIGTKKGLRLPDLPTFDAFKQLTAEIRANLVEMKVTRPTPVQKAAFLQILSGQDIVACAHTGCGKTLAFLLPLVVNLQNDTPNNDMREGPISPRCLIISPTRELAAQTYETARQLTRNTGVTPGLIYGGYHVTTNLQNLRSDAPITMLVATMGRLLDFIEHGDVTLENLKYLVLDEGDRMVRTYGTAPKIPIVVKERIPGKQREEDDERRDFGYDLGKIIPGPKERPYQAILFSATFDYEARSSDLTPFMKKDYIFVEVDQIGSANQQIEQYVLMVSQPEKRDKLFELLNIDSETLEVDEDTKNMKVKTLVFVNTINMCNTLAAMLGNCGYKVISMHRDLPQEVRERTLDDFNNKRFDIMVASGVAARGLNIQFLDHVINYDIPKFCFDEYVNRIGRTGRAGFSGRSTAFYDPNMDSEAASKLVEVLETAGKPVPDFLLQDHAGGGQNADNDDEDW